MLIALTIIYLKKNILIASTLLKTTVYFICKGNRKKMERARHEESEAGEFSHKIPSILMDILGFSLGFKEKICYLCNLVTWVWLFHLEWEIHKAFRWEEAFGTPPAQKSSLQFGWQLLIPSPAKSFQWQVPSHCTSQPILLSNASDGKKNSSVCNLYAISLFSLWIFVRLCFH